MRVGIFVPNSPPKAGGGFTFENEIFLALLRHAKHTRHEFVLFAPSVYPVTQLKELVGHDFETVPIRFVALRRIIGRLGGLINLFFTGALQLPHVMPFEGWIDRQLFKHRVGFFLNLTPVTLTKEVPYLTFLWDLQHRLQPFFPEISARGRWVRWEEKFSTLLQRAAVIVVATQTGKGEVEKFYGIPEARIKILPYPAPTFATKAAAKTKEPFPAEIDASRPYLFYPAQFWPHKNHVTLLRAVRILREKYSLDFQVVFTGSDQGNLGYVKKVVANLDLVDCVHFRGFVSLSELVALYQNAFALVYTSMFGPDNLPPLEAFALGCPVIAARVPGSAEQLGAGAILIPPTDGEGFADTIHQLHEEPALRAELIEKGRAHVLSFNDEDFARGIFAILDDFELVRQSWSQEERHEIQLSWRRFFRG